MKTLSLRSICLAMIATAGLLVSPSLSTAGTVAFIPPNDTIGSVFTTNLNDAYNQGRGIVFAMTANTTIDSVGIYQDLTGVTLNYDVALVPTTSGQVDSGETILRSGSTVATTSGLQFIDFSFAPLALQSGFDYHIEFSFSSASNQNFFYNNGNVTWTQGAFTSLDGTQNGNTANFVVPAIRVHTVDAVVGTPEPATLISVAMGAIVMIGVARRRAILARV